MQIDKYKLLVFDLDGTLVHTTAEYRYFIVLKVLKILGVKRKVSLRNIDKFWFDGNRTKTITEDFGCNKIEFWKVFRKEDKFEERAKYTHVYDDVWEVTEKLISYGKRLAITTGAPKPIAKIELSLLPQDRFEKVISITSTRYKAKPNPESLTGCLKFCQTKPEDAVYIGNSNEDGEYAKAAGMDFIYIERKEHSFFGEYTAIIHSLQELIS
jgi:HAD superfamily hydrolase (TIGR01549 family)